MGQVLPWRKKLWRSRIGWSRQRASHHRLGLTLKRGLATTNRNWKHLWLQGKHCVPINQGLRCLNVIEQARHRCESHGLVTKKQKTRGSSLSRLSYTAIRIGRVTLVGHWTCLVCSSDCQFSLNIYQIIIIISLL